MIRVFQIGVIFVWFVPEEEIKSLIEKDHNFHISVLIYFWDITSKLVIIFNLYDALWFTRFTMFKKIGIYLASLLSIAAIPKILKKKVVVITSSWTLKV